MREKLKNKRRRKRKIIGFSILSILVLLVAGLGFAYYQLQPDNHFNEIPVVGTGGSADSEKGSTQKNDNPEFNVLLIGTDQRKGDKLGHSDSMILFHVDLKNKKYQAISIPRDTRVHLDGYGYTKLTSVQYIMQAKKGTKEGIEAAVNSVSELTGATINYYVVTNYWGFQSMIDAVGGIEMNVPFDVKITHPWYPENQDKVIKTGTQSLNGKMVAEIVHERYSLPNGEFGRQKLQEEALKGLAKKALSPSNIGNLPSLVKSVPNFIVGTNMSTSDMLSMGLSAKDFDPGTQLEYHQLPGQGKTMYDDILKANNYQFVVDENEIKKIVSENFDM